MIQHETSRYFSSIGESSLYAEIKVQAAPRQISYHVLMAVYAILKPVNSVPCIEVINNGRQQFCCIITVHFFPVNGC